MENNGEKISTVTLNESYIEQFGISKCEDKILLTKSSENSPTRNFIIRNINRTINEGDLVLTFKNEEKKLDEKIDVSVVWLNKPISLRDPEKAIEFLSFIEPDSVVDDLLSADEEDYSKVL